MMIDNDARAMAGKALSDLKGVNSSLNESAKKTTKRLLFDLSTVSTGDTTAVTIGFKPNKVTAYANMAGTIMFSVGTQISIQNMITLHQTSSGAIFTTSDYGELLRVGDSASDYFTGVITAFNDTGFVITWTKFGTISGTIVIEMLAEVV